MRKYYIIKMKDLICNFKRRFILFEYVIYFRLVNLFVYKEN